MEYASLPHDDNIRRPAGFPEIVYETGPDIEYWFDLPMRPVYQLWPLLVVPIVVVAAVAIALVRMRQRQLSPVGEIKWRQ